jgi:hypothetical protein
MLRRLLVPLAAVMVLAGAIAGITVVVTAAPAAAGWPPQCLPQMEPPPDCPPQDPPVTTTPEERTKENLADGCTRETLAEAARTANNQLLFTLVVTVRYCLRVDRVEVLELTNDVRRQGFDPNLTIASTGTNSIRNNLTADVFINSGRQFRACVPTCFDLVLFLQGGVTLRGVQATFGIAPV